MAGSCQLNYEIVPIYAAILPPPIAPLPPPDVPFSSMPPTQTPGFLFLLFMLLFRHFLVSSN